jgi:prevent-host-death family protein
MTQQLNIHETKTQLSKLIELTQAGEEFVIAKAGKPVAKLVPLDKARPPRKLGLLDGKISIPEDYDAPLSDEVLTEFEGRG